MLDGTTAEIKPREALRINPAKTCQPIGAMYAALGIHGCMPHSHGSQGCCAYHRSHLTRHFKEPVVATTSSFTEGASVFGGLANMTQALSNIFTIYNPEIVAVHTTCLSEVIGDDIPMMIKKATEEGIIPKGKVRHPRQHAELRRFACHRFRQHGHRHGAIPGRIQRQDEAQSKAVVNSTSFPASLIPPTCANSSASSTEMGVKTVVFPDTSGVLDLPQDGRYRMFPQRRRHD